MRKAERKLTIINKVGFILGKPSPGLPWVLRVGLEHWAGNFQNVRSAGDNFMLAYIQDGVLAVEGVGERIETEPGSVFYQPQENGDRELTVNSRRGLRLLIVVVRGSIGVDLATNCLGCNARQFKLGDSSRVESLLLCMHQAASKGYVNSSDIVANLLLPTLQTIRQENAAAAASVNSNQLLFNRCREFINHHYLDVSSVAAVARKFGISHAWLCRLFKQFEGCPPHQFLLRRKMTHALFELQQRYRSVADIGEELGFSDSYSFSKAFKRVMGFSPSRAKSGRR